MVLYIVCTDFSKIIGVTLMYLVPYLLIGLVFAGALVLLLRLRGMYDVDNPTGLAARAMLSVLLVCLVGVLWYYTSEGSLVEMKLDKYDNIAFWVRVVSALLCVGWIVDVWTDGRKEAK